MRRLTASHISSQAPFLQLKNTNDVKASSEYSHKTKSNTSAEQSVTVTYVRVTELLKTIKPRCAQSAAWVSKVLCGENKLCLVKCLSFHHLLLWTCCMRGPWHPWTTDCTSCLPTVGSTMSAFTIQHKAIIKKFHFSPLQTCALFSHLTLPENIQVV